jgi:Protein of unknown function (DUF2478)/DSBA-like thioredoxin domain
MRRRPEPRAAAAPDGHDFYFDFASPYGFIAAMQIEAKERAVRRRPFLLGAVYKTFGQSPLDHPLKRKYVIEVDAPRMARRIGLELKIPADFPEHSLTPSRAFYWIEQQDPAKVVAFAKAVYRRGIGWTALPLAMPPWRPMRPPPCLGRGLVRRFSAAIEAGVAVLTGVRPPYDQAWCAFHGGCAHDLAPKMQEIIDWALASSARLPAHLSQGQTASIQDGAERRWCSLSDRHAG